MMVRTWLLSEEGNAVLSSLTQFMPCAEAERALMSAWDRAIREASVIAGSAAEHPYNTGEAFDCATFIEAEIWKLRAAPPEGKAP